MYSQQQAHGDPTHQQISNLYATFPGRVVEIEPRSRYQVQLFSARVQLSFSAVVLFPQNFPSVRPLISVEPPLAHPWIDGRMDLVGHPNIVSWNGGVFISKILKDLEMEFSLRPPRILPHSSLVQPPPPTQPLQLQQTIQHSREDTSRATFPELDTRTASELKELLESEKAFTEFFEDTKACKKAKKVFNELAAQNVDLARSNLVLVTEAEAASQQLHENLLALDKEKQRLVDFLKSNKHIFEKYSNATIVKTFQRKIEGLNAESEKLLIQFIDEQGIEVNSFIRNYYDLRLYFHQRSLDLEKLKQRK